MCASVGQATETRMGRKNKNKCMYLGAALKLFRRRSGLQGRSALRHNNKYIVLRALFNACVLLLMISFVALNGTFPKQYHHRGKIKYEVVSAGKAVQHSVCRPARKKHVRSYVIRHQRSDMFQTKKTIRCKREGQEFGLSCRPPTLRPIDYNNSLRSGGGSK